MKASEFRKLISEEVKKVLKEDAVKIGRAKNLKLKSDKNGVEITRTDSNDMGRIASQTYIFKDEINDLIIFLNKVK
jgi:hypothetical protein